MTLGTFHAYKPRIVVAIRWDGAEETLAALRNAWTSTGQHHFNPANGQAPGTLLWWPPGAAPMLIFRGDWVVYDPPVSLVFDDAEFHTRFKAVSPGTVWIPE